MNQSTCILVAVATKSLRARWKSFDWREQKHLHTGREKWNKQRSLELKYISVQRQRNKMIILRVGDHVLNINLCEFVIPLIFTEIQRKGIRFFNKSNDVSLTYRRFIYVCHGNLKSAATRPLCLFYFHQFRNWVCSNYCGAMTISWKICSWFARYIVRGTSRYINTMVCACQFLVEWEGFIFAHYLW